MNQLGPTRTGSVSHDLYLMWIGSDLSLFTDGKVDVYGITRVQFTGAAIFTLNAKAGDSE